MRRFPASLRLPQTVSVIALATAFAAPAYAQTSQPTAPQPEACANIKDDAQKQACAQASEQVDPLANTGEAETLPTQGATASSEGTQANEGNIVVTGSRLRRDERTSVDPLTVIDPNVENREGKLDTAEILQTSPIARGSTQITSTLSSNFVVNGGEGVQTISLRGLGANRTLVLLNGRRAGPAGVRGGVSAFDLNVIPEDAIQSIEILKTGASSIYGSDAIAGVVNLITKKDLRGLQVRGFASVPEEDGGAQYSISGTYGMGIGDRGHLTVGVNWNRFKELERGDRDFLGCEEENVRSEATGRIADPRDPRTGDPYCGAFPTNILFLSTVASLKTGTNNLVGPCVPAIPGVSGGGCPLNFTRRPITAIQFNDPGTRLDEFLSPPNSGLFFSPANPTQFDAPAGFFPVGGFSADGLALANNFDNRALGDSVIPETKRFTVFGEAGYDLTDNVNLYFEGLYNRRQTRTDASRQLFFFQFPGQATTRFSGLGPYNLPYFFCDPTIPQCDPTATGDPLNAGFSGATLIEPIVYAPANSSTDVKYMRGLAGVRANLDNILPKGFADFYFQHSRSDGDYNRDVIFRDAVEFGVAELRTDLCAGTLTAIRQVPCLDINYTDPRVLRGEFTPEERAFLFGVDHGNTLYKQSTAELTFGGDLFNLPGGAVKFALGGQWRRDSINDTPGQASLTNNSWQSTTAGVTAGVQRTLEAFGETELPLLRDLPFVHELTLNGAARVTSTKAVRDFDGATDKDTGNWTYKLAANWSPTSWLRLRATKGTSFRSPALFEQFLNNETGFQGQGIDPCIRWGLSDNTELRENCEAAGVPDDYTGAGSSAIVASRGNVGQLDPETSKALTLSAIFTPDTWLWNGGQFSFAVDYIDIKVKDQVTQLGAANILFSCFTSDFFPDDPLCDLFVRDTDPDSPRAFNIISVEDPYFNIDSQHNKSLDFTTRFRQNMGSWGTLSVLGEMTVTLKDKFTLFEGTTVDDNGESGDPKWVSNLNISWAKKPLTITYGLQVISKTADLEDLEDVGGSQLTPNNCLATASAFALRGGPYCPIYKLPRVAYHSISAEYQVTNNISVLAGVANLFDRKPPTVSTVGAPISAFAQVPTLGSYYDYLGRRFFVSARAKLGSLGLGL
jgi:iron complex outermembrane receptor protein